MKTNKSIQYSGYDNLGVRSEGISRLRLFYISLLNEKQTEVLCCVC